MAILICGSVPTRVVLGWGCIIVIGCVAAGAAKAQPTSNFNEAWLDAVISIERRTDSAVTPLGTGFLLATDTDELVLVTAAHVILRDPTGPRDPSNLRSRLQYRRTDIDGEDATISDETLPAGTWVFSEDEDLAVRRVDWAEEANSIPVSAIISRESIQVGAPLLILGFPFGLPSISHEKPIARRGIVARKEPGGVIADAFVHPGNSGSPVVYLPVIKSSLRRLIQLEGASYFLDQEGLVGMVVSYVPYPEAMIRTRRWEVLFEENSGLCNVIGGDVILALLREHGFVP